VTTRSNAASVTIETGSPAHEDAVARSRRVRSRWLVHLFLLAAFAASLATVTLTPEGSPHLMIGSAFVALAAVHVAQRRHIVARLAGNLGRIRSWLTRRGRLADLQHDLHRLFRESPSPPRPWAVLRRHLTYGSRVEV
jgi:hypothetical protein